MLKILSLVFTSLMFIGYFGFLIWFLVLLVYDAPINVGIYLLGTGAFFGLVAYYIDDYID